MKSATLNRLDATKQFALNIAIREFPNDPSHKPFDDMNDAERFFCKSLGFVVTKHNIDSAIEICGQDRAKIVQPSKKGGQFAKYLNQRFEALEARCESLEKLVAELESLVKS